MTSSVASISNKKPRIRYFSRLAKKMVLAHLKNLHSGHLVIIDADERYEFGQPASETNLSGQLIVQDDSFYQDILMSGSIGAAESYMTGDWTTTDLTMLVRIMVKNMSVLDNLEGGVAALGKPILKWIHRLNQNSPKGSRRNIAAHYDLGNDLFKLFLDPNMMYSSGVFPTQSSSLQQASENKLRLICEKLNLSASDHVVEIGTGWGGFAIYAAKIYGCKVTTTTISEQQYQYAQQQVLQEGLSEQITLLKQDYRDLDGKFDKLVSIEMIEAVGWKFYNTFFDKCSSLLKDNGAMLIQAITIEDQRYEKAKKDVDFIQRYIFPGSCIPSINALLDANRKTSDMRLVQLQDYAEHYARTLRAWHDAFNHNKRAAEALGYSEDFQRMWQFYLSYCEGGFKERAIGVSHLMFAKPNYRSQVA